MFGADAVPAELVEIDGHPVTTGSPRRAVNAGLGLLTEDRKQQGLMLALPIRENASIASLPRLARAGFVDKGAERDTVEQHLGGLRLRAGSWEQPVSSLSGGNQQKVLLARWLATHARVLLFDEPTKGVDVGAKSEIYTVIGDLAAQGLAVIVVSSYLPEVLGLADRVLVMRRGRSRACSTRPEPRRRTCCTSRAPARPDREAAMAESALPRKRVIGFGDLFGRDAGGIVILIVLFGALTLASDQFLTADNMANLARQVAIFGIIAVGELLVILTAGIDLSRSLAAGAAAGQEVQRQRLSSRSR
ncbi:ATP-binding cassette domain-containing protein [Luedemannella flava]